MINTNVKITPYRCRVIFLEYQDIVTRRKNLTEFIVKTDLIDLYRRLNTPKITLQEFIHVCLNIFVKVADLHEMTHDFFKNYLEGVGTIDKSDEGARMSGKRTCQEEIINWGFTKSHILTYIYYGILCDKVAKDKVSLKGILTEVMEEKAKLTHANLEESLRKLNQKVREVDELINQVRSIKMDFDITDSLNTLDNMRNKIEKVNQVQQRNMEVISDKMNKLNQTIHQTGEQFHKLNENTELIVNRFGLILDQLGSKLNTETLKAESALAKQKQMAFNVMNDVEKINNITERLNNSLSELENLFIDTSFSMDLLDTLRKVQGFITELQSSTRGQALVTKEIDEKVQTIEEGIIVIKKVLDSLNTIMREDILISLARADKGVKGTASSVEAIGGKYKQIRGGFINEFGS